MENLTSGRSISCGCYRAEHPNGRTHGETGTRLHTIWMGVANRCKNSGSSIFHHYGGRGIVMDSAWESSYVVFRAWAHANGYRDGLELDRIDVNGGYSPNNCRWVTHSVNMRNTRVNRMICAFGETKPLIDWVEDQRCIVAESALRQRLRRGWAPEQAIAAMKR